MSRNGLGTYTLPSGNPVVSSTLIAANWANTTLSDVAVAITGSLPRDGQAPMTAPLKLVDGSLGSPAVTFNTDPTTGAFLNGAGLLSFAVSGALSLSLSTTGINNTDIGVTTPKSGTFTSLNSGPLAGFRNVLHNGSMIIAQRPIGVVSGGYVLDRWFANMAGTTLTVGRYGPASNMPTNTNSYVMTLGTNSAGNTDSNVEQRIEAANSRHLAGKTVTVSYWVYHSAAGNKNITTQLAYANAFNDFTATTAISSSANQVLPTGVWTKVVYTAFIPIGATAGLRVTLCAGIGSIAAGQQYAIGEVQMELGAVATPFEYRPESIELALCQRYYEIGTIHLLASPTAGNQYSTTALTYKTTKRVTPTITFAVAYNSGAFNPPVAIAQAIDSCGYYCTSIAANNQAEITGTFTSSADL